MLKHKAHIVDVQTQSANINMRIENKKDKLACEFDTEQMQMAQAQIAKADTPVFV